ncbi:MAG TPA: type II toxin-antitoxin system HicB family antitoxin [Bacillus bacterium]|nr:type II toxin-antitoxin system HicB family antitoxin [Bacillus sp. (in: firmicutes)]
MEIDYPIVLKSIPKDAGGGWVAEHPDLNGCIADGSSKKEALENLEYAKEIWIETALNRKIQIPLPKCEKTEDFSGKLTLRLPKNMHRNLSNQAKEEGVSLNQYILYLLSFNYGQHELLTIIKKSLNELAPTININMESHKRVRKASKDLEDVLSEQWSGVNTHNRWNPKSLGKEMWGVINNE